MGGQGESHAAAAAASAASAAAQAAAAAVMNQPVASVQASTGTMEQVRYIFKLPNVKPQAGCLSQQVHAT